jgi:hypothetical protein
MKDLIIQALDEAYSILETNIPQTKKVSCRIDFDIVGKTTYDIITFMKDNNIPENAKIYNEIINDNYIESYLAYIIDIPTTEKDIIIYKRNNFDIIAFKNVYQLLTKNGYKRIKYKSSYEYFNLSYEFSKKGNQIYDLYLINKDFDKLAEYYSLNFEKIM